MSIGSANREGRKGRLGVVFGLAATLAFCSMLLTGIAYADPQAASGEGADDLTVGSVMTTQSGNQVTYGLSVSELSGGARHSTSEFFEAVGSDLALYLLANAPYAGYTQLGASGDATDTTSVYRALDFIRECNELRAAHGLSALKVTDSLMAVAESDTNWSSVNMAHSMQYAVAENLSWGYKDPFTGWYYEEKALKEQGAPESEWGHYQNIIEPSYAVTGFALSYQNTMFGETAGQVFLSSAPTGEEAYTVDEWQARFNAWRATLRDEMYRLYNPNSGEHFYTADANEKNYLVGLGWHDEGIGWKAPGLSGAPVYRLYNANGGEHHYTTSASERDFLAGVGWSYEGVGWYSDEAKAAPLYRLYNPNAFANNHHYTTSASERDWLLGLGWRDEGTAWYGV